MTLWVNGASPTGGMTARFAKGYVGLEAEGYRIEFRSVKLKVLDGKSVGEQGPRS